MVNDKGTRVKESDNILDLGKEKHDKDNERACNSDCGERHLGIEYLLICR